jgi:hypothetical protein
MPRATLIIAAVALALQLPTGAAAAKERTTRATAPCQAAAPFSPSGPALPPTVLVSDPVSKAAPYQCWADQMLVPGPPGRVQLRVSICRHEFAGCMEWTRPLATIGLARYGRTRQVLYHELGHVFDYYVLKPVGFRQRFQGIEGQPWETPRSEEAFADLYSECATRRDLKRGPITTGHGLRLTRQRFRAGCAFIRDAAAEWERLRPDTGLG